MDWREVTNDALTLSEAGFVKKSKVMVLTKKSYSENPEDKVTIHLEYEGTAYDISAHKEQEFTELVCQFFNVRTFLMIFTARITPLPPSPMR